MYIQKTIATQKTVRRKLAFTLAEVFSSHFAGSRKHAFTLAEVFSSHFAGSRKHAFTLAEVLITLGIIGIVAAMTLPALITKYEKKQTAVRLKQTYTQLQQAIQMSVAENGEITEWNWSQENWFDKYIVKYLKLAKNKGEFKVFDYKNQDEIDAGDYIPYKQINGEQEIWLALLRKGFSGSRNYILANGVELITYNDVSSLGTDIIVDLNTSSRKPNQFGKDAFLITIFKNYGLQFWGIKPTEECSFEGNIDRNYLMSSDSCIFRYQCNKNGRGMWCGALIMLDGWEIKDDYPW